MSPVGRWRPLVLALSLRLPEVYRVQQRGSDCPQLSPNYRVGPGFTGLQSRECDTLRYRDDGDALRLNYLDYIKICFKRYQHMR